MSKKKKKLQKRLSVAELKQLVHKPEVVEQWDVTAADPRLLVLLKSYRNVVPVPKHWCQKRHFLMGKRGVEKPPFKLPEFIEATGIAKIRAAVMEREAGKKLKGKPTFPLRYTNRGHLLQSLSARPMFHTTHTETCLAADTPPALIGPPL